MKRIPEHITEQILQESNIVDIIHDVIPLTKAGSNYKARCPFHQEKTASMMVSPAKQIFHCFGCGVGGNVLSFVMKYEQIDFPAAIEKLAKRLNIKLTLQKASPQDAHKETLFRINAYAHWFFKTKLKESKQTQDYLHNRHLSDEVINQYELGYAPDGFENLVTFLNQKKAPLDKAMQLGVIKKKSGSGYYDFYRDRLMFPIHNAVGKIVGFGGRLLSNKEEAKYLNSSESPVYNKSYELYGLYQAKKAIARANEAIIVEGYIDVLASVQLGIHNVVAPLGTSLTPGQIKTLKRYANQILLMFDGDDAGIKATQKAILTCFEAGIHPKLVILQDNKDPGDYLEIPEEQESLKKQVNQAVYAMEWLFARHATKATHEAASRATVIKGLSQWIKRLPDSIAQMEYRKKLAEYFDISAPDVEKIVEITHKSDRLDHPEFRDPPLETRLIGHYLNNPKVFPGEKVSPFCSEFKDNGLKQLGLFIENYLKNHETFDTAHAIQDLPAELSNILSHTILLNEKAQVTLDAESCIQKFQQLIDKKKLKTITAKILEADVTKNTALKLKLLQEKQQLIANIKK
jgi:DNA primase